MAILSMQTVILSQPAVAKAETVNKVWSWTDKNPTIFSSTAASGIPSSYCPYYYQTKDIAGEASPKKVCMIANDGVKFGNYFTSSYFASAVGFTYDSKMYQMGGICARYDSCLYLPDSDTLAVKQNLTGGLTRSLVLYKNFIHRLTRFFDFYTKTSKYSFDASNPDYIFHSSDNYAWPIGGFGVSDNGEWLAVEIRQRGIGLLNVETLEMKRISNLAFEYNIGIDPTVELAVSNDGRHVAVMGERASLRVFDVNPDCGDIVTNYKIGMMMIPVSQSCRTAQIDRTDLIHQFIAALHPRFSDDGGELNFYALSYSGESREISLRAAGYNVQKLDYLALGDSFTSGEGETDDKYYLSGTNDEYEKCHISTRSYPFLVSDLMGINPLNMASVACSGAKMKDIVGSDASYSGQGNRLSKNGMGLNDADMIMAQAGAKESLLPGRVRQESFARKYQPKSITVGIGGNDADFVGKLRVCISSNTCEMASTDEGKEKTAVEIKNLFGALVNTYQKLHEASPQSKIYVIGYPKIISSVGQCSLLNGYLLDSTERQFMNEGIIYLNKVIAAAAQSVGVKYIDIQESYGNHVLCGASEPIAMNAIRFGDDNAVSDKVKWFKPIGNESFHPNSFGHIYAANSIIGSVDNFVTYDYCANDNVVCPDKTISAPEPSSYWIPDKYHDYPVQKNTEYVFNQDDSINGLQKHLILKGGSLAPNSPIDVEITSNTKQLGQFTANNDGALDVSVLLPTDLEYGYHTVHLYGTSYSGESVELYQVISHNQPNEQLGTATKNGPSKTETTIEKQLGKLLLADNAINSATNDTSNLNGFNDSNLKAGTVKGVSTVFNNQATVMTEANPNKNSRGHKEVSLYLIAGAPLILTVVTSLLFSLRRRIMER